MADAKASHRPETAHQGWEIVPFDPTTDLSAYSARAIVEYPTANGPAVYGLVVDGQLLGVADSPFNLRGFRVPFLYIPHLEYIVFLRPVKSRVLFEQMLGRGTRRGEHYSHKSHFTVFDCFDGTLLEYFRKATAITAEPPDKPVRTTQQIIEDIWSNRDRDYNIRCLVKRLQRIEKEMSRDARELFAGYVDGGDMGRYARELPGRLKYDFPATMELLRKLAFQELLVNYPRAKRSFLVAVEQEDTVTSRYWIRDGLGNEYKPEDYLVAFRKFDEENQDKVDAIGVLLDHPRDWSTKALVELKVKLTAAPQHLPSRTCNAPTNCITIRPSSKSFRWSSTPPTRATALHGGRAGRASVRESHDRALVHIPAATVARPHQVTFDRKLEDRRGRFRRDSNLRPGWRLETDG